MRQVKGVWLPDREAHLTAWAKEENWRYQGEKLDAALKYARRFDVAVDVGAHCGLWSKELIKKFSRVVAFEPMGVHRECFVKNVEGNFEIYPYALGDKTGKVKLTWNPDSTGDTRIHHNGQHEVEMKRLDDIYIGPCDFLKIDTEGYEEFVLRGATALLRHKPVVVVEQKPNKAKEYGLKDTGAVEYLKSLGATLREVMKGDYILSWDD